MKKMLLLAITHGVAVFIGFAAGIYALPILIAPESPTADEVSSVSGQAMFTGQFRRDLEGSDGLHWGEGEISVSGSSIAFQGELAPGPDYKLYLSPTFVETENQFNSLKSKMVRVGDIKTFNNFIVELPADVNPDQFTTAIVWCETFGQFITAAQYR
ncbi:DM13 domain-containing protein [Hahella ganghwensis]|uniref:DM13 domain-containing protein n=1 Tax=Hahella ganghwensis TaxID=286420 RepID=UPI00036FD69A|nr:DM13 domain-containing protein [Hahella ganghwensis]